MMKSIAPQPALFSTRPVTGARIILCAMLVSSGALAATFTVTNTDDSGPGTLRQAIAGSNAQSSGGANTIEFNISGAGPHVIAPLSQLPAITEPVTIDGYTQPGAVTNSSMSAFNGTVQIILEGTNVGSSVSGLLLSGSNTTVRGLDIVGFDANQCNGIELTSSASNCVVAGCLIGLGLDGTRQGNNNAGVLINGATHNRIGGTAPSARDVISGNNIGVEISGGGTNLVEGCILGADLAGVSVVGSSGYGVYVLNSSGNQIGGTEPGAGNLISGNGTFGVRLEESKDNQIPGNLIGLDVSGTRSLGSQADGISIGGSDDTTVGGTTAAARNVISGGSVGILVTSWTTPGTGTLIQGNYIGTDVSGQLAVPNSIAGVRITVPNQTIGGTAAGAGNLISGNTGSGISLYTFSQATNIVIQGNIIGADVTGANPLPNSDGVNINNASHNLIGNTTAGAGNLIAFNQNAGVTVSSGTGNAILGNAIFQNGALGIDLDGDGVTLNDPGDTDTGANNLQNFPSLKYGIVGAGGSTVSGTLSSQPNTLYRVEAFDNDTCDPSGYGQGRTFLGATNVMTDAEGNANFSFATATAPTVGSTVTATATDPDGNTSEFSACAPVVPYGSVDLSVAVTEPPSPVGLGVPVTYLISVTNHGPTDATGVRVTNTLPVGAVFSSATNSQGSFSQSGDVVVFDLGTLANGGAATLAVTASLNTPGNNTNQVVAIANEDDYAPGNNSIQTTTLAGLFDLQVGLAGSPATVTAGQSVTLTVSVTNTGPDAAGNVAVRVYAGGYYYYYPPEGFADVSASVSQGSFSQTPYPRTVVTWNLGTLAAGAVAQATVQGIAVDVATNLSLAQLFSYAGYDQNTANNSAPLVSTVVTAGSGIFTIGPRQTFPESAGAALVPVERISGSSGTVAVQYTTKPQTAVSPDDYTHTAGTLTFTNGQTEEFISVPIINDTLPECNETFLVSLFNPTGGAALLSASNGVVVIADDDFGPLPSVHAVAALNPPQRITMSGYDTPFTLEDALDAVMTPDGRYVAFDADAPNLTRVKAATNGTVAYDTFLFDRQTGALKLVSVATNGLSGDNNSYTPSVSDDGRYVAFESYADNLVPGDTNNLLDVFLRDTVLGTTTLVSTNAAGGGPGNGESSFPVISADGSTLAFESYANNLTAAGGNNTSDVFAYHVANHSLELVSVNTNGLQGNGNSGYLTLSADGKVIVFTSTASDLAPDDTNGTDDVFVRDLQTETTTLVSRGTNGAAGNGYSYMDAVSADGRYVFFDSQASDLAPNDNNGVEDVFVYDRQTGVTTLLSTNAAGTGSGNAVSYFDSISADGRYVAMESPASNLITPAVTSGHYNVYVRDRTSGDVTLVSVNTNGSASDGDAYDCQVSADGRYVAFDSTGDDLVPDFIPGLSSYANNNVYRRDLQTGVTTLLSHQEGRSSTGGDNTSFTGGANSSPYQPYSSFLSTNGQVTLFESSADSLVPGNGASSDSLNNIYLNDAASGTNVIVDAVPSATPSQATESPVLSQNGRFVAFTTKADELAANDENGGEDVFLRDLQTGELTLISANSAGTATANSDSLYPHLSADGRYIAFISYATDITPGDTNSLADVYVRDRLTGAAELISADTNGMAVGSGEASISADGRFVAFTSSVGGIVPGVRSGVGNVYVRDRLLGTTKLVSMNLSGTGGGNANSYSPTISPDGGHVFFQSLATDLAPDTPTPANGGSTEYAYVRDLETRVTTLLISPDQKSAYSGSFSQDGRYFVFMSAGAFVPEDANNGYDVYVRDLTTGKTTLVSQNLDGSGAGDGPSLSESEDPSISANGRYVAFDSYATNLVANDTNSAEQVFVRDLATGVTRLVSMNCDGSAPGDSGSLTPQISADGRLVAFESYADDLVPGLVSGSYENIFLRDLALQQTRLVSVSTNGLDAGNNPVLPLNWVASSSPEISADGGAVVFLSSADNLVSDDNNLSDDAFYAQPGIFVNEADLSVTLSANPASPGLGTNVTLTASVQNLGPDLASNVVLTALIPSGLNYSSASLSQGIYTHTSDTVIASFGNLAANAPATLTVHVAAAALGTQMVLASAFADTADSTPANNYTEAAISIAQTGSGGQPPSLSVARAGGLVNITWPSSATGYVLQTATNLTPPVVWQYVTNGISDNGTWKNYAVTNATASIRFFRLIQ